MGRVAGRRVVVTGGSSGIGLAVAQRLLAAGARVAMLARRRERLEAEARTAGGADGRALPVVCDLGDAASIEAAARAAIAALGGVDAIVHAAGIADFGAMSELAAEAFDRQIATNLRGPFLLTRALLGDLDDGGDIVFVLSVAAVKGFAGCTAYAASKAGLRGMALALREDLRDRRIRVALVTPGATDTPLWDTLGSDFERGVMMATADVAHAVHAVLEQGDRSTIEEILLRPIGGDL